MAVLHLNLFPINALPHWKTSWLLLALLLCGNLACGQTRTDGTRLASRNATLPRNQAVQNHRPSRVVAANHAQHLAPTAIQYSDQQQFVDSTVEHELSDSYSTDGGFAIDASGCDSGCGSSSSCGEACSCLFDWSRTELWAGVTGFTVPANVVSSTNPRGAVAGSFGFQEGFNVGARLPGLLYGQIGSQLGMRFVQSQVDGSAAGPDHRQQLFATAGLFRRVDYGLQGGLVVDYLHDDWVYQSDLLQLRGELDFMLTTCHDIGFRFTDSLQTDDTTARLSGSPSVVPIRLTALNNYRFFYRYRFGPQARGQAEFQAGFTEDAGAILGLNLQVPLQNQLGLVVNSSYLMPPSDVTPSYAFEGWNLSIAIAWTPGRPFGRRCDYYRPLFDVADNGSLISQNR